MTRDGADRRRTVADLSSLLQRSRPRPATVGAQWGPASRSPKKPRRAPSRVRPTRARTGQPGQSCSACHPDSVSQPAPGQSVEGTDVRSEANAAEDSPTIASPGRLGAVRFIPPPLGVQVGRVFHVGHQAFSASIDVGGAVAKSSTCRVRVGSSGSSSPDFQGAHQVIPTLPNLHRSRWSRVIGLTPEAGAMFTPIRAPNPSPATTG